MVELFLPTIEHNHLQLHTKTTRYQITYHFKYHNLTKRQYLIKFQTKYPHLSTHQYIRKYQTKRQHQPKYQNKYLTKHQDLTKYLPQNKHPKIYQTKYQIPYLNQYITKYHYNHQHLRAYHLQHQNDHSNLKTKLLMPHNYHSILPNLIFTNKYTRLQKHNITISNVKQYHKHYSTYNPAPIKYHKMTPNTNTLTKSLTKHIKSNTSNKHTKYQIYNKNINTYSLINNHKNLTYNKTNYTSNFDTLNSLPLYIKTLIQTQPITTNQHYKKYHLLLQCLDTPYQVQYQNQYTYQYHYRIEFQNQTTKYSTNNIIQTQNTTTKQYLQPKTASAYRPRHKDKNNYQITYNWAPRKTTNHTSKNNTNTYFTTQPLTFKIHALPNLYSTTKFTFTKYLKLNKQKPKIIQTHGYYFINKLTLLQCGDIEPNPGPMPNILRTHPTAHKKRAKKYFIPNTIKLQPEYQHIASTFAPILKTNHPLHQQTNTKYPYLQQYITTHSHSPQPHILYALIITIHPSITICNNTLAQPHTYDFNDIWTNTLIIRLANLNNPPERHILTPHPYTTFIENNQDIINPKNSIHTELYKSIHNQETPPTPNTLQRKFPFLPDKLITESLRCLENINEYSHPPPLPNIPIHTPSTITSTNHETNIITWNAASLNTALPNLQSLINHSLGNTTIINIQETKLTATKSTKYIQNLFPEYKLIFNNTHALTRCIQQRMPYTPGRGGLFTLIHNKYAFPGNINKIPTPTNISPYLQIIKINNHPLPPWLIIHMYMPTHDEDIHLILFLKTAITNQINTHPNHIHILCGDFNRDIALTGRQNNNSHTPPQEEDLQWKNFTSSLNLEYIPTNTTLSRQGGYNYTSTSLIDGFYINSLDNSKYTSTTNTNMNLTSDHYPVTLRIPHNTLIARPIPLPNNTQTRILNPIPLKNLEKINIVFFEENSTKLNELTRLLDNHSHLTHNQWQEACIALDNIIRKISETIEKTCGAPPIQTLTNKTAQQGGFLPRKLSREWKKHLDTYHLSRKNYIHCKKQPTLANPPHPKRNPKPSTCANPTSTYNTHPPK